MRQTNGATTIHPSPNPNFWQAIACFCWSIPLWLLPIVAQAQITAAPDSTGTIVTPTGNRFDITGGSFSGDGKNLFHSLQQFGLTQNQIAHFLANPGTQNVLVRVTGGNASVINGLIQMTGSNANLHLMNPAGVIFEGNASLSVPGSFTVTTATGIGFSGGWFSAIGSNNYAALVDNPTSFGFTAAQPGAIVNAAALAVGDGQNLSLLGGTVINTGTLTAPGGNIVVTAVPGSSLVRLSLPGLLLNLEVQPIDPTASNPNSLTFSPRSLPELLTGGGLAAATGVEVTADGQVRLVSDPTVVIQPGTVAIADSLNTASFFTSAGSVWVDAAGSILGTATANINGSSFLQGGNITFRSGDSIQFLGVLATGAVAGASGTVDLAAKNNLAFGSIETINLNAGTGGAVMLTSLLGSVTGGKVWTFGENTGGDLTVKAYQSIDLGEVFTFGTIGNAGFVKLDPIGDIVVKSIDARGGTSGRGGNVVIITDRYFRATEPISGTAFSILTSGGAGGGSITIQHGGGLLDTPFTIGDAILNGTFGDISTGGFMLNAGQTLRESFMSGNIQVTTSVPPVVPPIGMPPIGMPPIDIAPIVPVPIEPVNPVSVTHSTGMATATLSPSAASAEVTAFDQRPTDSASATSNTGNSDSPASFEVDSFEVERTFTRQYEQHLGITPPTPIKSIQEIRQRTIELNRSTGKKTAFIYVEFKDKQVKLTLITAQSTTARVAPTNEATVLATAKTLIKTVSDRKPRQHYLPPSQQLYNWLIKPLSSQLAAEKIQNLIFIVDEGLRSLPFAALHDGQSFLVERYSLSLMPTYSLVSRNQSELTIKNSVLAMGASQFEFLTPLPAVPWELEMVTQAFPNLPQDKQFFNQAFTRQALRNQLLSQPYGVVHLATHTLVEPGDISNSYIQFTDGRLRLSDLDKDATLWQRVNLLVLSACNTALDDRQAEMGFAGIAIKSGVRSTLASLWRVDDVGTLVLMQQFYQALQQEPPLIAEALQQAQIAMLKGKARFSRQLLRSSSAPTPDQLSLRLKSSELEGLRDHPYYWAAFTLIGQPR